MKKLFSILLVLITLGIGHTAFSYADGGKQQQLSIDELLFTSEEDDGQHTTTVGDATSSCNMYGSTQVCLTVSPRGSCARVSTPTGSHTIGDNC